MCMRDEALYLDDILEAARQLQQFLHGVSKDQFLDSDLLQSAVLQKLTVIGEAAARISETTKLRYPGVKWKSIVGFRNIAVHVYYELDWTIVWKTATTQIEDLSTDVATIIENNFPLPDETFNE
jgi:uncharacterized protein with HEPN domain